MKKQLLEIIQCPICNSPLKLVELKTSVNNNIMEVEMGLLQCLADHNHIFPIVNDIPRMLPNAIGIHYNSIKEYEAKLPDDIKTILSDILSDFCKKKSKSMVEASEQFQFE